MRLLSTSLIALLLTATLEFPLDASPTRRLTAANYQRMRGRRIRPAPQGFPLLNWVTPAMLVGGATSAYAYLTKEDEDEAVVENVSDEEVTVQKGEESTRLKSGETVVFSLPDIRALKTSGPVQVQYRGELINLGHGFSGSSVPE